MYEPDRLAGGGLALGEAADEGEDTGGVVAEGAVDDDIVGGGGGSGGGGVVEAVVEEGLDAVAVGGG